MKEVDLEYSFNTFPSAICPFYQPSKSNQPIAPYLAMAEGSNIYMYQRNNTSNANTTAASKFVLPSLEMNVLEKEIWKSTTLPTESDEVDSEIVKDLETSLRGLVESTYTELSTRGKEFLSLETDIEKVAFFREVVGSGAYSLSQSPSITCMAVLKKNIDEEQAIGYLVVGTEEKIVYIIDPARNRILERFQLSSPISQISTWGLYDINYRLIVICRDSSVYLLKGDTCKRIVQLEVPHIAMLSFEDSVLIANWNCQVESFNMEGKRMFALQLPAPITALSPFVIRSKNIQAYMVGLENQQVRIYHQRHLLSTVELSGIPMYLHFGMFSREPSTLVAVCTHGGVCIRILRRHGPSAIQALITEVLNTTERKLVAPEEETPISIPKKSRLYLDWMEREKSSSADMYKLYQNNLLKFKLLAGGTYLGVLNKRLDPMAVKQGAVNVKMVVELQGLGPVFRLKIIVHNLMGRQVDGLTLQVLFNPDEFIVSPNVVMAVGDGLTLLSFNLFTNNRLLLMLASLYPIETTAYNIHYDYAYRSN